MIEKKPAFITTDGAPFLNQDAAQEHEFDLLFKEQMKEWMQENADFRKAVMTTLVAHKAEVLAILATRKPRTPKAAKASKSRKAAAINAALQDMKQ